MKTPSVNSRILKLEVSKDTATRASVNAVESRTTSLESDVATLTQGIVDARNAAHTAGVITQPSFSAAADGASFTVGSNGVYALYPDPLKGDVVNYTIAGGTFPLADGVTTYLVAKYNSGSPVLATTTNREELDFQQVVPVLTLNREGATVHTGYTSSAGIALAEKMHSCQLTVNRYQIERGALVLGASGQNVTVGAGYVWRGGVERTLCGAFTSVSNLFSKWVNVSGTWTKYPVTTWENTYYQGATDQVELQNANRFAVTHVFRTVGDVVECLYVLGTGNYTLEEAVASGLPSSLPPIATTHAVYVGRIIAAKGATTAYSVQAPIRADSYAPVSDHAALSNVLPSSTSQYHLTNSELEFFGTLPSTISALTSNVEEVDTNFVSITYNPVGIGAGRGLYSGLMSETTPTQSSTGLTTWVNQGTASATDTTVGLQIVNPTTGADDNIRGLAKPVPATPYTLTALLELASINGNYPSALLGWADSASTKTHIVTLCGDGRSGFISPTTYSSWTLSGAPQFTRDGRRCWLQLSDDGTTITVRWSFSGVYWYTLFSGAKASSHLGAEGYNRLFFGASSSGITGVATLLSWSIS